MNIRPSGILVPIEFKHFHMCGGSGSGAAGFNDGSARLGNIVVTPRCLGSVDVDPAGCADFEMMTGTKASCLDLFDERQYLAFHGKTPPRGWRPVTPDDIWRAQQCETPDIAFASYPCKGFSGLLSETASRTDKYQALNGMTERGMFLLLEANRNNPIKIILFENVPRIATRGRVFIDRIKAMLRAYDYVVEETEHDCGELGNLGQSRKRFLMVARHAPQVPNFLYEPVKYPLRGVGEILDRLPVPLSGIGGPLHRMPALQWKTWVRLALVKAGSDWRSLNDLAVENGALRDFGIAREYGYNGTLGVTNWGEPAPTISSRSTPTTGSYAVADPRATSGHQGSGKYRVTGFDEPAGTVIAASTTGQGAFAVQDPRVYLTAGHYGVVPYDATTRAVTGAGQHDNGFNSVADPRDPRTCAEAQTETNACLPAANDKVVCVIRALDGTWHRPFTTLECAALQSMFDPEKYFTSPEDYWDLHGMSDSAKRERIGNAVPRASAKGMASAIYLCLLNAMNGETFTLSSQPIWVQPVALAIAAGAAR